MKKLFSLLTATSIIAGASTSAVSCGDNKSSTPQQDENNKKVNLKEIVKNENDLGPIGENAKVTKDQVIEAFVTIFKIKDNRLTEDDLEIEGNLADNANEATIKAKSSSKVFTDSVKVTFTIKKMQLSSIVGKNDNLGEVGEDGKVTKDQVIEAFVTKFKSKEPRLTKDDLEIEGNLADDAKEAIIKAKPSSKFFTGFVKDTFTAKKIQLTSFVDGNNNLSEIGENAKVTKDQVIEAFVKIFKIKDKRLTKDDLEIEGNLAENAKEAIIKAKPSSKLFTGSVKVTFTAKKIQLDSLTNYGEDNNLGEFDKAVKKVNNSDITERFLEKYSKKARISKNDLEVTKLEKTWAKISAKSTSENWTGYTVVQFSFKKYNLANLVIDKEWPDWTSGIISMTEKDFREWNKVRQVFVDKYEKNTGLEVDDLQEPKLEYGRGERPFTFIKATKDNPRFIGEVRTIIIVVNGKNNY